MNISVTGSLRNGKVYDNSTATIYKGCPKPEAPTTYKKLGVLSTSLGNLYNTALMTIYQAKDKTFRYEIYRDGCFYPYYGKIVF